MEKVMQTLEEIKGLIERKELSKPFQTTIQGRGSVHSIYIQKAVKELKLEKGDIVEYTIKKIGHREQKVRNKNGFKAEKTPTEIIVPNIQAPEVKLPDLNEYEQKALIFIKGREVAEHEFLLKQAKEQWDMQNIVADIEKVKLHLNKMLEMI